MAGESVTTEVIPCPFCGEPPKAGESIPRHEPEGIFTLGYVRCLNSNCHVRPSVGSVQKKGKAKDSAIKRWNKRP